MASYILRRVLLVFPTLLGILLVNFVLIQFVPGGPVEQAIARIQGGGDVFSGFAGGGADPGAQDTGVVESQYVGARGLPPEFIEELEAQFGFDKPPAERFLNMVWDYLRFDFGESYFRSVGVIDLVIE
ncbi:MAG: microcin ABC transporter permease, partial [Pseudomonadota bacterium]